MWVLWLCVGRLSGFYFCKSGSIVKDREYETGFRYDILICVSDWKGLFKFWWTCLVDCFQWFWVVTRLITSSW